MDIKEVEKEIAELEIGPTTYSACEKLAMLYGVRNGMRKQEPQKEATLPPYGYSFASEPSSEFVEAARVAPFEDFLKVMDEHMEAILAVYPKEYKAVIRKIKGI